MENYVLTVFSLNYPLSFGKYKGTKIVDILEKDLNYLFWLRDNVKWLKFDESIIKIIDEKYYGKEWIQVLDDRVEAHKRKHLIDVAIKKSEDLDRQYLSDKRNKNAAIVADFLIEMTLKEIQNGKKFTRNNRKR
jgi:hypothetical protein